MRKKIKITRRELLRVIRTEPNLMSGSWFAPEDAASYGAAQLLWQKPLSEFKKCKVCAVGALLRNRVDASKSLQLLNDELGHLIQCPTVELSCGLSDELEIAKKLVQAKDYLSALSCAFESIAEREPTRKITKRGRDKLATFVKKNFPINMRIEIPA